MNNNISYRNNQAFSKDNLNLVYALGGSTPATFTPERQSGFTPLRVNMLKFMFNAFNFREVTCYAQETIARRLGCSRKAVNEAFMFFKEIKIIDFISGKKKWTMNVYSLGEVLHNPYIRWALRFTFTNLTRAYFKMVERLNPTPKSAVVEPKVTQLTNVNVLEELNTSICSYRKRKDCKKTCFKEHKEDRIYTEPYLNKKDWINRQKAMWNDWSLTKENFNKDVVTIKDYEKFYKNSDFSKEEVQVKISKQAHNQEWNNKRYKNDQASYQNYLDAYGNERKKAVFIPEYHEFKSESYKVAVVGKTTREDVITAKEKIEEAKKKEPNNYWLQKFKMPGL